MTDQLVITEKTSQAKDVRAAVGPRYGTILPAEGHLFDLFGGFRWAARHAAMRVLMDTDTS